MTLSVAVSGRVLHYSHFSWSVWQLSVLEKCCVVSQRIKTFTSFNNSTVSKSIASIRSYTIRHYTTLYFATHLKFLRIYSASTTTVLNISSSYNFQRMVKIWSLFHFSRAQKNGRTCDDRSSSQRPPGGSGDSSTSQRYVPNMKNDRCPAGNARPRPYQCQKWRAGWNFLPEVSEDGVIVVAHNALLRVRPWIFLVQ